MTPVTIARRDMPLDDLVARVYHLELSECRDLLEFKEGIRLLLRNVDEVLDTLCCYRPEERRVRRAVERVKQRAVTLRNLCSAIPETFDGPEGWRRAADYILANYEQFRVEAGLLYQIAVPGASFGVLRAAL
ncbi:MAG TPA: hypothetical protein VE133_14570 [Candidatus Sulfotelmatobacter sp.]|nr:hypothetical protein [Candidatus Sulfotelmatobacter sp.]